MSVRDELAELVADVRAVLDDGIVRGVRAEGPPQALPEVAPAAPEVAPNEPSERASRWAELAAEARERPTSGAEALAAVRADLGDCRRCALASGRKQIVFGVGDPSADLVVVGEAPGYHEDQQGEPFVGPAGQMLDKMLVHVLGLSRERHVYILNMVKCRPPRNRDPEPIEVEACRPFLEGQLAALRPKVILVLGRVAMQALFRTDETISRARGRWRDYQGVPTMPTFHPAYLLRKPEDKRLTFADLKAVRERYDELGGARTS
jgi:DNA polymerase